MQRVEEGFLPIVRATPGFVAYYALDAGDGVIASINIFKDRAGSEESNRKAAEWVREEIGSLLPDPPQTTMGEVKAHTRAELVGAE